MPQFEDHGRVPPPRGWRPYVFGAIVLATLLVSLWLAFRLF